MVQHKDGGDDVLDVQVYVVETDVPFLSGKRTLEQWGSKLDTRNGILETNINVSKKEFRMVTTDSSHYGIILETRNRGDKKILYLEDKETDLTSFKFIRKVYKVNNHKGSDQLVSAYSRAGWMSPEVSNIIKRVVKECKVCQKFASLYIDPR